MPVCAGNQEFGFI